MHTDVVRICLSLPIYVAVKGYGEPRSLPSFVWGFDYNFTNYNCFEKKRIRKTLNFEKEPEFHPSGNTCIK